MESCSLEMEAFIKVNSTQIKYMVGDSIHGTNPKNIMDNGSITRCVGWVYSNGRTDKYMKVASSIVNAMEKVY